MKPFSTYPEDRQRLLGLAACVLDTHYPLDMKAVELADLVKAILEDEQFVIDAGPWAENELLRSALEDIATDEREHGDDDWSSYYRMKQAAERALNGEYSRDPVAVVVNDNQPGKTATIQILSEPPTISVGEKLYAKRGGAK